MSRFFTIYFVLELLVSGVFIYYEGFLLFFLLCILGAFLGMMGTRYILGIHKGSDISTTLVRGLGFLCLLVPGILSDIIGIILILFPAFCIKVSLFSILFSFFKSDRDMSNGGFTREDLHDGFRNNGFGAGGFAGGNSGFRNSGFSSGGSGTSGFSSAQFYTFTSSPRGHGFRGRDSEFYEGEIIDVEVLDTNTSKLAPENKSSKD